MAQLLVLLAVCFFVQVSYADFDRYYNEKIRSRLNLCEKLQTEPDSLKYIDDLKKLSEILEGGLKLKTADEKLQVLKGFQNQFSPEFNSWFGNKRKADHYNREIQREIQFYQSLLTNNNKYNVEIKNTLATLEHLLKEAYLEEKHKNFMALEEKFSADFEKFVDEQKLPAVNEDLNYADKLFELILYEKDLKFAKEIQDLKAKTRAALANNVHIDEKIKVLHDTYYIGNKELEQYIRSKNIEYIYKS